jgi:hypothetical protein
MTNKKWNELTKEQKDAVKKHYEICLNDEKMECRNLCKTIQGFWENHKEIDYRDW